MTTSNLHSEDPIKKFLFLLFLAFIVAGLTTCCKPQTITKTETRYEIKPGAASRISVPIPSRSSTPTIIETPQKIKVILERLPGDSILIAPECPPDSVIKETVTIKVHPTFKEIKQTLTDSQKFRLGFQYIISAFVLGIVLTFIVLLLLRIR